MPIGTLFEIVLFVENMPAQVRFYRDVLGLELSTPFEPEASDTPKWVTFTSGACTLALHAGGQRRFGGDAPQFYFLVDDVETARAVLLENGESMSEVRHPNPTSAFCSGQDPEGNCFGLESRAD
jgi:predicted enzyme related to lactoylglutathione lyase